jgi:hypothetical protein
MEPSSKSGFSTPPRVRNNTLDGASNLDADRFHTPVRARRAREKSLEPPPAPGGRKNDTPLLKAVRRGNIQEVAAILKKDPELARDRVVEPPLCCAVRHQTLSKEMLQLLLQHGSEVNAVSYTGDTCLHTLCNSLQKNFTPLTGFGQLFSEDVNVDKGLSSWDYFGAFMNELSQMMPPPMPMQLGILPDVLPTNGFLFELPCSGGVFLGSMQEQAHKKPILVATMLLAAGAKPLETIKGHPAQLAREAGHQNLARLIECYEAAQAYFVLCKGRETKRSMASETSKLGKGLIGHICSFLVSEDNDGTMSKIAQLEVERSTVTGGFPEGD